MATSRPRSEFDSAYAEGSTPPWDIGEPQPAIVQLERTGQISGRVLDAGCGTGEHAIYLAQRGYDALGIDFAPRAIALADQKAAARNAPAQFAVADALELTGPPRFDTVVDCGLFHVFGAQDQAKYVANLHAVCRPGALVHVLALSNRGPGIGPAMSDEPLREAFIEGWRLRVQESTLRVLVPPDTDPAWGLTPNQPADIPAWLATAEHVG